MRNLLPDSSAATAPYVTQAVLAQTLPAHVIGHTKTPRQRKSTAKSASKKCVSVDKNLAQQKKTKRTHNTRKWQQNAPHSN